MTGSHEVSGSIPLISTKRLRLEIKRFPVFFFAFTNFYRQNKQPVRCAFFEKPAPKPTRGKKQRSKIIVLLHCFCICG